MTWEELNKKLFSDEELDKIKKEFQEATEWAKKAGYTNDELQKKQAENSDRLVSIRGGIITGMVELEQQLCSFLGLYFSKDKYGEFCEQVLTKEFFTTSQKIKLFQRIAYHKQEKYKRKYDGLSGIMFKLNELRNLVAHGTTFHYTRPELGFAYSGEATHFDENLNKMFKNAFEQVWFSLRSLIKDLLEENLNKKLKKDDSTILGDLTNNKIE